MNTNTNTNTNQTTNQTKHIIVDLKNGDKVEGILVNIDKVNFIMSMIRCKKTTTDDNQTKETLHDALEINKEDIKEVKIVQVEEETFNINAIPSNKIIITQPDEKKSYNKDDGFFDNLAFMNNREARTETYKYNEKNKETFGLPEDYVDERRRGGGRGGRGRGGRGRGGNGRGRGFNSSRGGNRGGYISRGGNQQSRGRGGYGYNNDGRRRGGNNNYQQQGFVNQFNQMHIQEREHYSGGGDDMDFFDKGGNKSSNRQFKPIEKSVYDI